MDWSQMMAKFREPFPTKQIKQRKEEYTNKKTGEVKKQTFDYVDAAHVIDRLNDVGGVYEFRVLHCETVDNQVVTLGELSVWNPDLGTWIRKQQNGSSLVQGGSEPVGNARKSSATDALKKCAQMFGIANHLWGGEITFAESEDAVEPVSVPAAIPPVSQAWRTDLNQGVGKLLTRLGAVTSPDAANVELTRLCEKYAVAGLDDPDLTEDAARNLFGDLKAMTLRLERTRAEK